MKYGIISLHLLMINQLFLVWEINYFMLFATIVINLIIENYVYFAIKL